MEGDDAPDEGAGARGGGAEPRVRGRHRKISGQDSTRESEVLKKIFGLRPKTRMIRGDLYLVTAASRPKTVLSSANFAEPTASGGTFS